MYDAIIKAAEQIENHPQTFLFRSISIPRKDGDCGTQACALGWIAHYGGNRFMNLFGLYPKGARLLGVSVWEFYERMDRFEQFWIIRGPEPAARALRMYAETYHAPEPESSVQEESAPEEQSPVMPCPAMA